MNGYTLIITNTLGQTMYSAPIDEQHKTVSLTTWTGNGVYFIHLLDARSNIIEVRKIILR
jgi:hypothetical protein